MEWLKPLLGHTVGLDTAPLIYFIERNPLYLPLVRPFFEAVEHGDIDIVTSTITLTEVLIHPLRQGNTALARQYSRILLAASHVQTHSRGVSADCHRSGPTASQLGIQDAGCYSTRYFAGRQCNVPRDKRRRSRQHIRPASRCSQAPASAALIDGYSPIPKPSNSI